MAIACPLDLDTLRHEIQSIYGCCGNHRRGER
jgi:hypothetical protein